MIVRELLTRVGLDVQQGDFQKADAAVGGLKKAAVALVAVFATRAMAAGFSRLVGLASAAAERTNKFRAVFTDASDGVQAQLDGISARTGIASGQLQEFAANIGAIIKPALGSSDAAGQMGSSVAELALDIASFNDVEPTDALVALRSGLIGSAEPLQQFGVDTRVAALKVEALRQGITGSVESMTEGERIQLRYSAIMRQLGAQGALGDAAKTSDELANATRGLHSRFKELGAIIGGFFLEGVKRITVMLRGVITSLTEDTMALENALLLVVSAVGALAFAAGLYLVSQLGQAVMTSLDLAVAFGKLGNAAVIAQLKSIAMGLAFIALAAVILLMLDEIITSLRGGDTLFGEMWDSIYRFINEPISPDDNWLIKLLKYAGKLFVWVQDKAAETVYAIISEFDKIQGPIDLLKALWNAPIKAWEATIVAFLRWLADKLEKVPILGKLADFVASGNEAAAEILKFNIGSSAPAGAGKGTASTAAGERGGAPYYVDASAWGGIAGSTVTPSVATSSASVVNANQIKTDIKIVQQPGEDPQELADRVSRSVDERLTIHFSDAYMATTPAVGGGS